MIDNRRRALIALTALLAVMETIDAFFIEHPAFAIGYAVVLGLLALWATRTRRPYPDVIIGLLAVLEFFSVLFVYPNSDDPPASWDTALFALVTFATTAAAAMSAVTRWKDRPAVKDPLGA